MPETLAVSPQRYALLAVKARSIGVDKLQMGRSALRRLNRYDAAFWRYAHSLDSPVE